MVWVFVVWTALPVFQMMSFYGRLKQVTKYDATPITHARFAFYPMSYVQTRIRIDLVTTIIENQIASGQISPEFLEFAISKLSEMETITPDQANIDVVLAKAYDTLANLRPKEKDYYYKVAENYFARSFALFPHYPQTEYAYLFHLMNSGKKEEALLMAKNILSRDPRVEQSQYYYGLLLYMVHPEKNADEALIHLEIALEQDIDPLPQLTGKVYNALMAHTYQVGNKEALVTVLKRLGALYPAGKEGYDQVIGFITKTGQIPVITITQGQ
jgi:tetratricopeptide (TPR) repeat protein